MKTDNVNVDVVFTVIHSKAKVKNKYNDFFVKKGLKRREVRYLFENGETWEIITFIMNKQKKRSEHLVEKNLLMNILQDGQQAFDIKMLLKSRR